MGTAALSACCTQISLSQDTDIANTLKALCSNPATQPLPLSAAQALTKTPSLQRGATTIKGVWERCVQEPPNLGQDTHSKVFQQIQHTKAYTRDLLLLI